MSINILPAYAYNNLIYNVYEFICDVERLVKGIYIKTTINNMYENSL